MTALLLFLVQLLQAMGAPVDVGPQGTIVVHAVHHGNRTALGRVDASGDDLAPTVDGYVEPTSEISNGF
jgi:hypothetical protein